MLINFPSIFTYGNLHSVWADIGPFKDSYSGTPTEIVIDLSKISYVDAEGANYIILLPYFLKSSGLEISITLPESDNVIRFLSTLRIIEYLESEFHIIRDKNYYKRKESEQILFKRHSHLISRFANTFIFQSGTVPNIFRHDIIKHSLFSFNDRMAKQCCVCIFELVKNIFDHSGETTGCFTIQTRRLKNQDNKSVEILLAVSDLGIGIKDSLYNYLKQEDPSIDESMCLKYAIMPGISRTGLKARGMGLNKVAQFADKMHLSSGKSSLLVDNQKQSQSTKVTDFLPGTSALIIFQEQSLKKDGLHNNRINSDR